MAVNPAASYGRDIRCVTDADALWSPATGLAIVYQAARHRLMADNVHGPGGDGWGYDCRELLGVKSAHVAAMQPVLAEVLQRDERILAADVKLTIVRIPSGLDDVRIEVTCHTAAGPFSFVMSARELTAGTIEGQAQ